MIKNNSCAWLLSDLAFVKKNNVTVMSTFACGGGSSMGYKRAGCTVIAANDIDPIVAWHYKENLKPKYFFQNPINELLTAELPDELYRLDILDGSPPCSTFSMTGSREKAWGKKKKFREGQSEQILSDLFFDYLNLVERLKPKVAIAENVKGLILGNAKGYCKMIMERFRGIGYRPQLFLLNAADCGVPQSRERVFFCAVRNDVSSAPLELKPDHKWVSAGEACCDIQNLTEEEKKETTPPGTHKRFWSKARKGASYANVCFKETGKGSYFNWNRLNDARPSRTLTGHHTNFAHWSACRTLTFREWIRLSSFPDDYQVKTAHDGKYMIGMSVPPKMTEIVARAVCNQWLKVQSVPLQ